MSAQDATVQRDDASTLTSTGPHRVPRVIANAMGGCNIRSGWAEISRPVAMTSARTDVTVLPVLFSRTKGVSYLLLAYHHAPRKGIPVRPEPLPRRRE